MTREDLATLACRIFALYVFFKALQHVGQLVQLGLYLLEYGREMDDAIFRRPVTLLLSPVVVMAMNMVLAAILWFRAERLAARMVPRTGTSPTPGPAPSGRELRDAAFHVTGLILMVTGLLDSITAYLNYQAVEPLMRQDARVLSPLIRGGVLMIIGIILFVGWRALSAFATRMQSAEPQRSDGDDTRPPAGGTS
jgi:hypothetical protein